MSYLYIATHIMKCELYFVLIFRVQGKCYGLERGDARNPFTFVATTKF